MAVCMRVRAREGHIKLGHGIGQTGGFVTFKSMWSIMQQSGVRGDLLGFGQSCEAGFPFLRSSGRLCNGTLA